MRVRVTKPNGWRFAIGASVAIDGVCSTVVAQGTKWFAVEYMPETLAKTNAGALTKGSLVNLERSLTLKAAIDGHLVSGHVDAPVRIMRVTSRAEQTDISFAIPKELQRFVAYKGSVALNGVSLTVSAHTRGNASVSLIPHTLEHTNLGLAHEGGALNLEVDLLARYVVAGREESGRVASHAAHRIRKEKGSKGRLKA